MPLPKLYLRLILWQSIILLTISCSSEKEPRLNVIHSINGLQVILSGNTSVEDSAISEITIDWGDGKSTNIQDKNFDAFEKRHLYAEPATYLISVTATDLTGVSTLNSLSVIVAFKEVDFGNIKESLYKTTDRDYLILTINLHTYQESMQNEKFNTITEIIGRMDIDFIAFQECAQNKSAKIVDGIIREDNMALIISNNLKQKFDVDYSYIWDWAHYGWNVWEEGVAILSKYPLIDAESKYVSSQKSKTSITSRKAILGSYRIPEGNFSFISAHTHWRTSETDNNQNFQIKNIQSIVTKNELTDTPITTFVCGDFNVNPTSGRPWSEGYHTMINNDEYVDTFLEIYPDANNTPAKRIYNTVGGSFPGRIDYIFMKNNSRVKVIDSQIIFTDAVVGKVSDHNGVLTKISIH